MMTASSAFTGTIRYFRGSSGLAVIDIPEPVATRLGGLKQMRVTGRLNGVEFASNTMPAGGRVLALSVSRKLLDSASLKVGDTARVQVERATT